MKKFDGVMKKFVPLLAVVASTFAPAADFANLRFDAQAAADAIPLFLQAAPVLEKVAARVAAHKRTLAKRGVAEEPMCPEGAKYALPTGVFGTLWFDDWGELYIDRRFVTDEEMKTLRKVERFAWEHVIGPLQAAAAAGATYAKNNDAGKTEKPSAIDASPAVKAGTRPPRSSAGAAGLPVFRGFEAARYQEHDELIARMTAAFNRDKAGWCGGTKEQAAKISDVSPAMVKAHMIEESGGRGERSVAAWKVDPLQINVPGDWGEEKLLLGLAKPRQRNEGSVEGNVRAAIMYLARKGFGASGRPARERPNGFFDGWLRALQRYNGRRDRTDTDRWYSDEYAERIIKRAKNPSAFVPIEIKLAK